MAENWTTLQPHIRAAVLALVGTTTPANTRPPTTLDDSLPPGFEPRAGS